MSTRRSTAPGRGTGWLLLLVAVLTAVIVPRLQSTLTSGIAVAASIDPPPQIGSCVARLDPARADGTAADQRVLVPSADYGRCSTPIAGEVLSVQVAADIADQVSPAAYDSASAGCSNAVDAYLGAPAGLNNASEATDWLPAARYTSLLVGPDPYQRAAGRTWSACVVATVASASYERPARGGFTDGSLDEKFGYCLNSTDLSDWVPCSTPHRAQVLAWGTPLRIGAEPARADCLAAAAALMHTTDPTKGSVLDVALISYHGVGSVQACGIRVHSDRKLTGSVVGIRGAPLIWTS